MEANPDIDLPSKLLLKVIDLMKPHPARRMLPPLQQSTLVIQLVRMEARHAPQGAVLQPLMIELLLLVPDELKVVSAVLKSILLLPTIADPSLLAKIPHWIRIVRNKGPVDPVLSEAIH
mmetsp:Transcript_17557/g.24117  ORF Transcript_17557/g.24117 Transcript_17557/m.24117 type:complete len:119 (-) Transcript_17557:361-717(-)